jgi:hypothetical protein
MFPGTLIRKMLNVKKVQIIGITFVEELLEEPVLARKIVVTTVPTGIIKRLRLEIILSVMTMRLY